MYRGLLALALIGCAKDDDTTPPVDTTEAVDTVDTTDTPNAVDTAPPADPPTAEKVALDALREASATPVVVSPSRGVPAAVYLNVPLAPLEPIDAAYAFLETYAPLYGLTDPRSQLWPERVQEAEGTHYQFAQRSSPDQGGLEVFNAHLTVHVLDGVIYMTTGRYLPDLHPTPPRLTSEEALAGVVLDPALRGLELQGEARLGLYAAWTEDGSSPQVSTVWRMSVTGLRTDNGDPAQWQIDVDAVTGQLVNRSDRVTSCDKDFDIMYGSHTNAAATCWAGWADTVDWFDEDGALGGYSSADDHNDDGEEAYQHAHTVFNYYRDTLGYCSYDDDDAEVEMVTHATVPNASASGFCGTMQFRDDFVVLDVVAHEFTHLVDYNAGNLEYVGQSGALDESFADAMASMVDRNWTIGEGLPGGAIRDLSDPTRFGDPDHMSGYVSGGDVHINSGIPNKAAWLLTVGGTHNGYAVTGLGWSKAERLLHAAHVGSLGDDADFRDARDALVGVATYWGVVGHHGFDADDACQVANAYAAVGVGVSVADSDCDGTTDGNEGDDDGDGQSDGQDNCPQLANVAQVDHDSDGLGDACDSDIDGDGDFNDDDNCVFVPNPSQADSNDDGIGDLCADMDGDGALDPYDNCPSVSNWNQANLDGDAFGDACDSDTDGDGAANASDNCPSKVNANQADRDGDQFGDVCDVCPSSWNPTQSKCDCPESIIETAKCSGAFDPQENVFVHPLDEVALPWVDVLDAVQVDDYRLQLTVTGTGEPWVVIDHAGNVVAHSDGLISPALAVQSADWTPATNYRYAVGGERASFATDYTLQMSPTVSARGVNVRLQIEAVAR